MTSDQLYCDTPTTPTCKRLPVMHGTPKLARVGNLDFNEKRTERGVPFKEYKHLWKMPLPNENNSPI